MNLCMCTSSSFYLMKLSPLMQSPIKKKVGEGCIIAAKLDHVHVWWRLICWEIGQTKNYKIAFKRYKAKLLFRKSKAFTKV